MRILSVIFLIGLCSFVEASTAPRMYKISGAELSVLSSKEVENINLENSWKNVTIIGFVRHPGIYFFQKKDVTLSEILNHAGVKSEKGQKVSRMITIVRRGKVFRTDLKKSNEELKILGGDVIFRKATLGL